MAKQAVDTEKIQETISKLRTTNNNIQGEFRTLQNKAKQLENSWRGAAGTVAQTTMYQLFKNSEERFNVIQNYINMLEQQINPGYFSAETTNKKLADNFK